MELNKEKILEADDLMIQRVDVPEWGGFVYVRSLSADESFAYNKSNIDDNGEMKDENFIVTYCSFVICDREGKMIFSIEDIKELGKKNTQAMVRIYEAAKELNGEDVEGLEKNSEPTQSEDSDSD